MHRLYLFLEVSEEEKAIIKLNRLDEIVLDETRIDISDRQRRELAEAVNDIHRKIIEESHAKQGRFFIIEHKLGDFLANPHRRAFYNGVAEANDYAIKLKTEILPRIKEIIATNSQTGPTSETFEL
jgi:hypothetical protein